MSANGGDDIEDIKQRLERIEEILRQALRAPDDVEEAEDEDGIDMWNVGEVIRPAVNVEDYLAIRRDAARSDNLVAPRYDGDDRVEFYLSLFVKNVENLQKIANSLSNSEFDEFTRRLSTEFGVANQELVDILQPGSSFFGVRVGEDGEVQFDRGKSNLRVLDVYGDLWYWPPVSKVNETLIDEEVDLSLPQISLQLPDPESGDPIPADIGDEQVRELAQPYIIEGERGSKVVGGSAVFGVNIDLARAIERRRDLDLPGEFSSLV